MTAILTEADAFLADIIANPADDFPRLVYADWLEEQGEAQRAEFIRVQCRLHQLQHSRGYIGFLGAEVERLLGREADLLGEQLGWIGVYPDGWSSWKLTWRRGFVAEVTLPTTAWLEHGSRLVQAQPLEQVELSDREPSQHGPRLIQGPPLEYWRWFTGSRAHGPDSNDLDELPGKLWKVYAQLTPVWEHEGKALALDALSAACLAWARLTEPRN